MMAEEKYIPNSFFQVCQAGGTPPCKSYTEWTCITCEKPVCPVHQKKSVCMVPENWLPAE